MAFKYLVSISPKKQSDSILGLYFLSGKKYNKTKDKITDIYTKPFGSDSPKQILKIIELSEIGNQENCHDTLLGELIYDLEKSFMKLAFSTIDKH